MTVFIIIMAVGSAVCVVASGLWVARSLVSELARRRSRQVDKKG